MDRAAAPVAVAIAAALLSGCSVLDDDRSLRAALAAETMLDADALAADIAADFGGQVAAPQLSDRLDEIAALMSAGLGYDADRPFQTVILDDAAPMIFQAPGRRLFITRGFAAMLGDDHEAAAAIGLTLAAPFGNELARAYLEPVDAGVDAVRALFPADTRIGARARRLVQPHLAADASDARAAVAPRVADAMLSRGFDPDGLVRFAFALRTSRAALSDLAGAPPTLAPDALFPLDAAAISTIVAEAREARETTLSRVARRLVEPQPEVLAAAIEGLPVGPGAKDAVYRNGLVAHPGLGVSVNAPAGATLISSPGALRMFTPNGARVLIEAFDNLPPTDHLDSYLRDRPGRALAVTGRLRDATEYRIGPFNAATTQTVIPAADGGAGFALSVLRQTRDSRLYEVTAVWPAANDRAGVDAAAVTSSIRPANPADNATAAIALVDAPSTPGSALGPSTAAWFALINSLPPGAEPAPGRPSRMIAPR